MFPNESRDFKESIPPSAAELGVQVLANWLLKKHEVNEDKFPNETYIRMDDKEQSTTVDKAYGQSNVQVTIHIHIKLFIFFGQCTTKHTSNTLTA